MSYSDKNQAKAYKWGGVLRFNARGNALPYLISGWAEPETDIIWTDGPNARLELPISEPDSDLVLCLRCEPYLYAPRLETQEIHLYSNFFRVGFLELAEVGSHNLEVHLSKDVIRGPKLTLDFYLPKACAPAQVGSGSDVRRLGIAVSQLNIIQL